jgi:outer membrane protein TolC
MIACVVAAALAQLPAANDRPERGPFLVPLPGPGPLLHRVSSVPAEAITSATGGDSSASAQLELNAVLVAADRAYPTILASQADVLAADADALAAAGGFDPALRARGFLTPDQLGPYPQVRVDTVIESPIPATGLSAFAGYRIGQPLSTTGIQSYYRERETYPAGELRAGLSAPLLRNLWIDRRRATLTRAELGQDAAKQALTVARIDIARVAAFRYWEWVAAGMRRQVAQDLLRIAKDRDRQLSVRVKTGDVPFFDQQDNLRAVAQRASFAVQTQRGIEQASFELALFLRDDRGQPTQPTESKLPPRMPDPDPAYGSGATIDDALARRPDVQRLLVQQRQQQVEVSLQKNQLFPAIDVGVVFAADLGRNPGTADPKLGQPEVEFTALVDVPLLYRLPLGRIRSAEATLTRIEAQLQLARDRVAAEVKDALSALGAARERVKFTREEVEVAVKLESGERQRFELGDSNLLFVNIRETQTAEARLREIDALLDYHRAVASFRAALAL